MGPMGGSLRTYREVEDYMNEIMHHSCAALYAQGKKPQDVSPNLIHILAWEKVRYRFDTPTIPIFKYGVEYFRTHPAVGIQSVEYEAYYQRHMSLQVPGNAAQKHP